MSPYGPVTSYNHSKVCESHSHLVMSDSLPPHGLYSHGILQARILEWVAFPFSRGSSQPRDRTQISHIAGRFFLPGEPPGKPKDTGVGSLSLLQWVFLTQELNRCLLHCRQIPKVNLDQPTKFTSP